MNRPAGFLVLAAILVSGCSKETPESSNPPAEQNLAITLGGFIQGGDEHQTVDGVCRLDRPRISMTCDIYNGLPQWNITELSIRITWSPYSDSDVRDFRERISIPSLTSGTVSFPLGLQLPDDTVIEGRVLNHWSWIVAAAKGVPAARAPTQ
jgi:hypothetical protein